jgi:hypothetical protein
MTKETGGPAYPCKDIIPRTEKGEYTGKEVSCTGLTMRDYFAAKAMAGYLTCESLWNDADTADEWITKTAKASYEMADKMLKARQE